MSTRRCGAITTMLPMRHTRAPRAPTRRVHPLAYGPPTLTTKPIRVDNDGAVVGVS